MSLVVKPLVIAALGCATLAGCHAQRPSESADRQAVVQLPSAEPVADAGTLPAGRVPAKVACRVHQDHVNGQVSARLNPASPPVLGIEDPRATIRFLVHRALAARLEMEKGGLVFDVVYVPHDLPLRLARPVIFSGHVIPRSKAKLSVLRASPGYVSVTYQLSDSFVKPGLVDANAPCSALTINPIELDPMSALSFGSSTGDKTLPAGRAVPFYQSAIGSELGSHQVKSDEVVLVYAERAGRSLITLDTGSEVLFGWVPSAALQPAPAGIGLGGIGTAGDGVGMRTKSHIRWVSCDRDLELYAKRGSEQGRIGTIRSGTRFEPQRPEADYTPVDFWANWLHMASGAGLLVRTNDLKACRRPARD